MSDNRDWAKDTFTEVLKEDPVRIVDLENNTQMLLSKIPGAPSEKDRAINNYRSMVFDEPKPAVDHLIEGAGRVIPPLATIGASVGVGALRKALKIGGKGLTEKLLKPIKNSIKTNYTHKAFKKHVNSQLKELEKKYGKTTIQNLNEKYFKNVKKPLDEFDEAALKLSPAGKANRNALNDMTDVYRNSIDNFIKDKISKYEGSAEDKYFKLMSQKDDLAKELNTTSDEVANIIKQIAGEEDIADQVRKHNFKYDIDRDVKANPEAYKNVPEKDYSKIWEKRKQIDEDLFNAPNKFLDENIDIARQPISQEELNKAADELGLSIKGQAKKLGKTALRRSAEKTGKHLIQDVPEFKNKTFDKAPDTSFPKTLLQSFTDIIGLDWRNPNRFNSEDIQYFLTRAQEEGLLSNDNWKNWSARQQVEKVDEIAHSDEGKRLVEMLRDE